MAIKELHVNRLESNKEYIMSRKVIIAGNWKMNKTASEGVALVKALKGLVADVDNVEIVVCPPFTSIEAVAKELKGSNIKVGAQNVHWKEKGKGFFGC